MSKLSFTAVVGAAALAMLSVGALAAPLSNNLAGADTGVQSLIQPVHGCHRNVEEGRRGWHYHAGYNCDRIGVAPPRRHYGGERYQRGPVCRRECQYVGPIKVCKDRCY